jgi:hypothetical protein
MIAFLFLAKEQLGNHCPFGFIEMIFTNIKLAATIGFISVSLGSSPPSTKAAFWLIHNRAYKMEAPIMLAVSVIATARKPF